MRALRPLVALAVCLLLEVGLAHWQPAARGYVDFMLIPVAWYGIARSQRSAMFAGCAAGLIQDAWFQAGIFGIHGFTKTLLGWILGGLGARFDLGNVPGRFVAGTGLFLLDRAVQRWMRQLLGLAPGPFHLLQWLTGAVVTGVVVVAAFGLVDRLRSGASRRLRNA